MNTVISTLHNRREFVSEELSSCQFSPHSSLSAFIQTVWKSLTSLINTTNSLWPASGFLNARRTILQECEIWVQFHPQTQKLSVNYYLRLPIRSTLDPKTFFPGA